MADRLVRPVSLPFAGREWPLLITYGVLLASENHSGIDMLGNVSNLLMPTMLGLVSLLWAGLARAGCEWTPSQVADRIELGEIDRLNGALRQAFVASMPDPEKKRENKEPEDLPGKPMDRLEIWACARIELGLTNEEFTDLTPRQFHALRERQIQGLQREELMFSRLTAKVINFSQCRPKEPLRDDYFMLHKFDSQPEEITGEFIMREMAKGRKR